ncbi:hypothetical protein [Halorubrum yunnanense]|uniref:DUF4382 domain-containing protein n=1 Tax=Halorubrum yunnanense TaxID=1526162 RepID=A0ABD5Y8P9_9EURY|nr:hypothetical protein [Halorubrum yunnanense]
MGTGAFSSVEAERGVEVNVVEDDEAYLGIAVDEEVDAVQIKNQFADRLDLTVTLNSADGAIGEIEAEGPITFVDGTGGESDIDVDDESGQGELGPGNEAHVRVDFDEAGEGSFALSFAGEAGGASVDKTREFTLRPRDVTGHVTEVKFPGNSGHLRILTGESNGNSGVSGVVSAKLYCEDDGNVTSSDDFEYVLVNENLGVEDFDGDLEGSIAGIEIEGIEGVFVKPDSSDNSTGNTVATDDTKTDPFGG